MPIHFLDIDVVSDLEGLHSALIVPCNMCPAVTVAVREKRPFIRFFRNFLRSAPFEEYLEAMQARLANEGVRTRIFRSDLPHHWFMCMWTEGQREKLREQAKTCDAVIVLGCESASATVREVIDSTDCKVIEGMEVSGIMNAKLALQFPGNVSFEDTTVVPMSPRAPNEDVSA